MTAPYKKPKKQTGVPNHEPAWESDYSGKRSQKMFLKALKDKFSEGSE